MVEAADLTAPVLRCLELAWEAWGRGTVPVGAVVTSSSDTILFEGRSRMYEQVAPPGELANSLLAHAEINALARLDPGQRHEQLRLTSSLEPCPLCLGAIGMATVGGLAYLGRDPYGGAVGRHQPTPHLERVPLQVDGPRDDETGLLASAMHVGFYLLRNRNGHVVQVHEQKAPEIVAAAQRLVSLGAAGLAERGIPLTEKLPELLVAISTQ